MEKAMLSRRRFIHLSALATAGGVVAACSTQAPSAHRAYGSARGGGAGGTGTS